MPNPSDSPRLRFALWDLGDTLITRPPGGQDLLPLDQYRDITLRPHAADVLDRLSAQGVQHAVLSNTARSDSADARRLLLRLGVLGRFQLVVATQSELDPERLGKPAPEVFWDLLREWGAPPECTVMVGNTFDHDVVGANRAGLAAIFLTNPTVSVGPAAAAALHLPPWVVPAWDLREVEGAWRLLENAAHGVPRTPNHP